MGVDPVSASIMAVGSIGAAAVGKPGLAKAFDDGGHLVKGRGVETSIAIPSGSVDSIPIGVEV